MSPRRPDRGERGMTLVELMIAMTLSTLVIFFLFSIQTRMSSAFRAQSDTAEVVEILRAARSYLAGDLRMAGSGLPDGVIDVAPTLDASGAIAALQVDNDASGDGPDLVRVIYGEPAGAGEVTSLGPVYAEITEVGDLRAGDRVVFASRSAACLVQLTLINPAQIHFDPSTGGQPFNHAPQNAHCDRVRSALAGGEPVRAFRAALRAYRVDTSRAGQGVLQLSRSGGVQDDWIDLGVGFTNLQLASRYGLKGDTVDADGDGDPERDWYSSDNQEPVDPTGTRPAGARLVQVSLSIELRTPFGVSGSVAAATPAFIDLDAPEHNRLGDWGQDCSGNPAAEVCGIDLAGTSDGERPSRYRGEHVYRASTTLIDLRNMGVGL